MKRLEELQYEVAQWSKENFGTQQSQVDPDLFLGSLAPLMGLAEEVGEYFEGGDEDVMVDALADVGIYLCDYASREGFILPEPHEAEDRATKEAKELDAVAALPILIGRLFHITLKRHQGIRGFDDARHYQGRRQTIVWDLVHVLDRCVREDHGELGDQWLVLVNRTWERQVQKRNWKKNRLAAYQVDREDPDTHPLDG